MIARSLDARRSVMLRAALVLFGSLLMVLGARVTVDVGPVPITLQTLALPLVVAMLGTRQSVAAMLAYLAEGAAGLPVFAGGFAGPGVLLGLTPGHSAGYLWACPVAAFAIGWAYDRGFAANALQRWIAICAGTSLVFAGGVAVLAAYIGLSAAVAYGAAPFIAGDLVKITLAAAVPTLWPRLKAAFAL